MILAAICGTDRQKVSLEAGTAVRKDSGGDMAACSKVVGAELKTSGLLAEVFLRCRGQLGGLLDVTTGGG